MASQNFGRSVNPTYLNKGGGAHYLSPPPDFHTFLRPYSRANLRCMNLFAPSFSSNLLTVKRLRESIVDSCVIFSSHCFHFELIIYFSSWKTLHIITFSTKVIKRLPWMHSDSCFTVDVPVTTENKWTGWKTRSPLKKTQRVVLTLDLNTSIIL